MGQTIVLGLPVMAWLFVVLAVGAVSFAGYTVLTERRRRLVLKRAGAAEGTVAPNVEDASKGAEPGFLERIAASMPWLSENEEQHTGKLVQAGFDSPSAASLFSIIRLVSGAGVPLLALLLAPKDSLPKFVLIVGIAAAIGIMMPTAIVDRLTQQRQDTVRKGIPDTLDLLVVCLEAGVALDAAVQRVARELSLVHKILSDELVGMSRRIAAGVPREQAMQALYSRTGVDELRSLASHMIQSEKWGTSIVTVLRVYGDQLRRKRRMEAEKRAATASTRMLFPLMIFIFPTIFVVLLGPAVMRISDMFGQIG